MRFSLRPVSLRPLSSTLSRALKFSTHPGRIAAQATVVVALVGGTVAYAQADTTVTLTVDGQSRQVSAHVDTVAELLDDQGLETGSRDLVAPTPDSELDEGDTVVVRYGRPLTVTVDGTQRTLWTTETTVEAALAALGVRADGARLTASRSQVIGRQGLSLALFTPKQVSVTADGKARTVTSTSATVADLLAELGITLSATDTLSVVPAAPVTAGLKVAVTRIVVKQVKATETVAYSTTKTSTSSLYKGDSKVVTAGRSGSRQAVYSVTYTDGKQTAKKLVSATVTKAPVTKVVQVGTKARPSTSSGSSGGGGSVSGADGLNWGALAQCESGGNPRIVSSNGLYYGLYQFSLSTWRSVGGSGLPTANSSAEQTYRAKVLYKKAGAGQWPVCGRRLFS